jgi:hypothetical protein
MISTSWFVFNCNELDDGTSQLMPAPHLNCFNDAWGNARVYAILTLTLWGILTPLVLALALQLSRSRLRTAEFSRRFSLITFGYKKHCVWWEVLSMAKKFMVSGCIVLFREYALVQCTLALVTMLSFLCLTVGIRPFYNRLISGLCILGEVRDGAIAATGFRFGMPRHVCVMGCAGVQVATFLLLASGVPFLLRDSSLDKPRFYTDFRLRFGFDVLKWVVLILLPLFVLFGFGLLSYEVYYQLQMTGGKGKRFQRLLASLRVQSAARTLADIKNIYEAIVESEFLKPYPYSKLVTICRACELLELQPQEAVFSEGDIGNHFFVLIKGTVDVFIKEKAPPHNKKCVNTLHDSGSFGELALLQVAHPVAHALAGSASITRAILGRFL